MHSVEIDDETFASLEALAKQEHTSLGGVIRKAVRRLSGGLRTGAALPPVQIPHGYKIPVSKGERPFSSEDVWAIEDDNDRRGLL